MFRFYLNCDNLIFDQSFSNIQQFLVGLIMDSHNEDHDVSIWDRRDACRCDCQHDLDMNGASKFQMLGGFNVGFNSFGTGTVTCGVTGS